MTKGKTTARGYGAAHQRARRRALAEFWDGQPCARCGQAMREGERLDLDHTDDRTGYRGLAHRSCNRRAGAIKGNLASGHRVRDALLPTPRGSRDW